MLNFHFLSNRIYKNKIFNSKLHIANKLKSNDGSINYIMNKSENEIVECRYVRRKESYISSYLSSHTGCIMGCKFCWLTQSGQKSFKHLTIDDYVYQLDTVLSDVPDLIEKRKDIRININFMARGEVMANKHAIGNYKLLYDKLDDTVKKYGYGAIKMNLSTIFPYTLRNTNLSNIFDGRPVNLYYSIYSINDKFRKLYLPNALPVEYALNELKKFQENHNNNNTIVFHCAFIKGENDDIDDISKMADLIRSYNFTNTKFNLVRLNPFIKDDKPIMLESELSKLKYIFDIMNSCVTNKIHTQQSRIVNRVGPDVFASCGMFSNTDIDMTLFDKIIDEINHEINDSV
jgi:adenine C2-methylase RlmN of 23S rRNA A2503 and tRNA A37